MLDLPQMGGRYAVSDILKSLGVDLNDLLTSVDGTVRIIFFCSKIWNFRKNSV